MPEPTRTGGELIADVLARQGVRVLFTLCGGHISPILVAAKARGIRVVDTRHEATAVFAADASARLTGVPGVAAVTAGPGVTNAVTAIKNAQLARVPIVVLGGATATILKGRGALQDIDQMAAIRPHVKWAASASTVGSLATLLDNAFGAARSGVPGPVFLECPVDLLYEEAMVRTWYGVDAAPAPGASLRQRAERWYLRRHLAKLFRDTGAAATSEPVGLTRSGPAPSEVARAAGYLGRAERPVLLVGSQAVEAPGEIEALSEATGTLGLPVFLSGMARGLLGASHPLQLRHHRKAALQEADLVILAGTPCDFRLDYGRHINRRAVLIAVNRDRAELTKNRHPTLAVAADPDLFVRALAGCRVAGGRWQSWLAALRARDEGRDQEIAERSKADAPPVNPLWLCREIDRVLPDNAIVVADGGDFVATASYIVRPRRPLSWLDPGVFGTLGVGAGFALGASLCRPGTEVWLLYGDGAAGYSLVELDRFVQHGIPVIAVVGNDGSWAQIAREQVIALKDDVGTVLGRASYHKVAEGFGARGLLLDRCDAAGDVLAEARSIARQGMPVLINALIGDVGFRKGSISI